MIVTLGKVGRIAEIYHDNDIKVEVCGDCWTYNPLAVTKINSNGSSNSGCFNNGTNSISSLNTPNMMNKLPVDNTGDGLRDFLKHIYESHVSGDIAEDLGK